MNNLSVFEFEGQRVRFVGSWDDPWWVAADICAVLEHTSTSVAVSRLDEDEKGKKIVLTPGGNQEMLCVNELGLYSLVLTSRKPKAKRFKKWLLSEVLSSIWEVGKYEINPQPNRTPLQPPQPPQPRQHQPAPQNYVQFIDTHKVTRNQLLVFCFVRDVQRWVSVLEIVENIGVNKANVAKNCLYFHRAGIFDLLEFYPGHRYCYSESAKDRNPSLLCRIETAVLAVL